MKIKLKNNRVALAGVLLLAAGQANAALTATPGNLLMGFAKVNAGGTGYEGSTYVYNLGPSTNYREAAGTPIVIDNINTDLAATFGPGWANDPTVRWGIVGVVGPTDPLTNGDPARTTYFSQDYLGAPGGSAAIILSSSARGSLSTNLRSFFTSMNGIAENGAVDGGAVYPVSAVNSFSSFLPPGPATYFGVGTNPLTAMTAGPNAGLDLYRTLHTATGAELNSAFDADAVVGTGQYVGTFLLTDSGGVSFVPEPSTGILALLASMAVLRRRRA
jgi:hypothetical protein